MYASLGRRIFEAKTMDGAWDVITELKQKLRDRIPSIGEVKALFPEIVYTEQLSKLRGLVKYILSRVQSDTRSGTVIDFEKMTIEHLVPQSRISDADQAESVVGQLGNLILVSEEMNTRLCDKPFLEKKNILTAAGFPLPAELAEADEWTENEIRTRTEAIAVLAYEKLWRI